MAACKRGSFGLTIVATALLLSGCTKSPPGEEFVGDWQSPAHKTEHISIERNGESFLIRDIGPFVIDGKLREAKLPATYQDGVLVATTGMGSTNFGHDRKRDTLVVATLGGSLDFTRISK